MVLVQSRGQAALTKEIRELKNKSQGGVKPGQKLKQKHVKTHFTIKAVDIMPENPQSKFPTGECDDIHQSQVEGLIVDALPSREVGCFYEIQVSGRKMLLFLWHQAAVQST